MNMKKSISNVNSLVDRCLAIRNGVETQSKVDVAYTLELLGNNPQLHLIKCESEAFDLIDLYEIQAHYHGQKGVEWDSIETPNYHLMQITFTESNIMLNLISNK